MAFQCVAVFVDENLLGLGFVVELHDEDGPFFLPEAKRVHVGGIVGKHADFLVEAGGDMKAGKGCFWNRDVRRDGGGYFRAFQFYDSRERPVIGEQLERPQDGVMLLLGGLGQVRLKDVI